MEISTSSSTWFEWFDLIDFWLTLCKSAESKLSSSSSQLRLPEVLVNCALDWSSEFSKTAAVGASSNFDMIDARFES